MSFRIYDVSAGLWHGAGATVLSGSAPPVFAESAILAVTLNASGESPGPVDRDGKKLASGEGAIANRRLPHPLVLQQQLAAGRPGVDGRRLSDSDACPIVLPNLPVMKANKPIAMAR